MARRKRAEPADDDGGAGPLRRCIASGRVQPTERMIRFVVGPEGDLVPDVDGRLPGRGLWLSADADMLHTACARSLFAKAARRRVEVPPDLDRRIEAQLARRCLDLIGLARRAGQAVAGYEKVRGWLAQGKVGLLLAAADGAEDGRRKVAALARAVIGGGLDVVDVLDGAELGAAMGRDRAVHVALAPGRLAERLKFQATRLAGFRRPEGPPPARPPRTRARTGRDGRDPMDDAG